MIDLRLGDCLEIMKTIPDKSIDLVLTDPPYALAGMNYESFNEMDLDLVNKLVLDFVKIAKQKARITIFPSGKFLTELMLYKEYPPNGVYVGIKGLVVEYLLLDLMIGKCCWSMEIRYVSINTIILDVKEKNWEDLGILVLKT